MDPARPRPMGIGDLISSAIRTYFSNANTLFLIVAILAVPFAILIFLLLNAAIPEELVDFDPARGDGTLSDLSIADFRSFIVVAVLSGIVSFIVSMVAIGACFVVVGDSLTGRPARGWRDAIQTAMARLPSLLWVPTLMGLLIFGGAVAGILVASVTALIAEPLAAIVGIALGCALIYFAVLWSLAVPALMAEDVRGMQALARSGELVKGRWWPTLGVYVIAFVIVFVINIVLNAIFGQQDPTGGADLVLAAVGAAISQVLFTPFQAAIIGVVYFDLRARKEPAQPPGMATPTDGPGMPQPPPPQGP